jgi:hypothetical protein
MTRWENVDQLLTRTERTKDETRIKAAQEIAALRFKFPTIEHPSYRTYVNVPDVTMAVQVGTTELVPEIVVVEKRSTGETLLKMTAVVAIVEEVNEDEARSLWGPVASIPDQAFYLYVPVGHGAEAKRICRKLNFRPEGYRTWRFTPRGFEINDISEPASPLALLMPGFVRRALATP